MDFEPNPVKSKFYNEDSISMIQAIGCDLLSQNHLQTKNHIILKLLAYISNCQKFDSRNKIKLDVFVNNLVHR